jgi:hypothetical protein
MQELLEKLVQAGWVAGSLTIDREGKNYSHTVQWTDAGKKNLEHFFFLIAQIETASKSQLSGEELAQLKGLALIEQMNRKKQS